MAEFSVADRKYMVRAIQLAKRGQYTTHPNPNVGCVLVRDGQVLAEGWTQPAGEAHAEVHALQQINHQAAGATAYVTLEPCSHYGRTPPCSDALIKSGVKRVVAAMVDPNPLVSGRGLDKLRQAGVETQYGLLESQVRQLMPGFISAMQRQQPFVRVKMAQSLDGRTAMASGESVWITGQAARRDVQFWRARAGAILTGIDTVLMDKPSMNVRLDAEDLGIDGVVRQPLRVILDSQLRCPPDAKLLQLAGDVLIYTCSEDNDKIRQLQDQGVRVERLSSVGDSIAEHSHGVAGDITDARLDLKAVLSALHAEGVNLVHVEAGATLSGAFVAQGLVDELLIYTAPFLMGSDARALLNMPLQTMQQGLRLQVYDMRAIGDDWRILAGFK
ncbi:MAG: bifunctional diaminohydroxyphosphoribosylaminopyrimidine deaminase/5-amino-6-(5-phosphoribosylamino)uracil reductase RibD [Thiolinea sp.]